MTWIAKYSGPDWGLTWSWMGKYSGPEYRITVVLNGGLHWPWVWQCIGPNRDYSSPDGDYIGPEWVYTVILIWITVVLMRITVALNGGSLQWPWVWDCMSPEGGVTLVMTGVKFSWMEIISIVSLNINCIKFSMFKS